MTSLLRLSALHERLRASLWLWPAMTVTVAVVTGVLLPELERRQGIVVGFAGTPEGARSVLATVAGSMITVTGLTFSLTVVALQVASSQFTPRLLGTFLADRGNQAVLSVFLGTFAYTLAVLRSVRSEVDGTGAFVPGIAVGVGLVLTLLSVAMLVFFFHHLTQQLRVESVLAELREDTLLLIRRHLPPEDEKPSAELPVVPEDAVAVRALRSGYLQAVNADVLLRVATDHDAVLRLRPVAGTHVTEHTTVAWAWPVTGGAEPFDVDALTRHLHRGIHLGAERTLQQDVAFGIRQIVDIAARALSPGMNDPTTAVAALETMASVLVALVSRRLTHIVRTDDDGRARAAVPQPSFGELLALACDQPRRYGRGEPAVLTELLRLLTDVAEVAPDQATRRAVRVQVETTVATAEGGDLGGADLGGAERARVRRFADHALAALERGSRTSEAPDRAAEPAS